MSAVLKEDHLNDEGPADDGSDIIVAEYDEPLPEEDDEKQTEATLLYSPAYAIFLGPIGSNRFNSTFGREG
ncbi:hypothetical protein QTG54_015800 [Skeletonema marinoi]|uniref:Uncharacterized protein n=1 Tax=Skeletonema marinoi TaxID=267567 RepID=A0AAD9D4K5_9STRA|nr:hypothetical protein QTG54_015800 [Skeletonema marinoi]